MWFLRLPWAVTCLGLVLSQTGVCAAKAQRSLTELDVTFYPGVTPEYEAALHYSEIRRFLKEEQREAEEEEEVVVRLLREEHESQLDEPIEFATQKRLLKQLDDLKALSSRGQTSGRTTSVSKDGASDPFLNKEPPVENNFYDVIKLFFPEKNRYETYSMEDDKQAVDGLVPSQEIIHKLEEAFRHPELGSIPDAIISRLLNSKPKSMSNFHRAEPDFLHHQYDSPHKEGISILPHDKVKTENHQLNGDHTAKHQALVHYLLVNQELIAPEDLDFILESEKYQQDDGDPTTSQNDDQTDDCNTRDLKDEDWEEDYEYDA